MIFYIEYDFFFLKKKSYLLLEKFELQFIIKKLYQNHDIMKKLSAKVNNIHQIQQDLQQQD